jgi:ribosomal-protein-alanine N-acetyltransferase
MSNYKVDKRNIFLKGKGVWLVALSSYDVENSNWYGWFNDEEVCLNLQKHYYPNTLSLQNEFLSNKVEKDKTILQLGIVDIKSEKLVGVTSFYSIDFINRKAGFSMVIGEKEARNISCFIEVSKLMLRHGFFTLNLQKIYGGTISVDLVILMCRALGCQREGELRRDVFKNGEYHSAYLYSILREEFKN